MRLFGGWSFGSGRARAGVSRHGRLWLGGRVRGPAGMYAGLIGATNGEGTEAPAPAARSTIRFEVDDAGRVFVGEGELELEALREVVRLADERRRG